jgi:hypothetical protein
MSFAPMDISRCLTEEQITRYLIAPLEASDELREADVHVASCERCRTALRAKEMRTLNPMELHSGNTINLTRDCLNSDLLLRYVRGEADVFETENVEMHIEDCRRCRSDLEALQAFHAEFSTYAEEPSPVFASPPLEPASQAEEATPVQETGARCGIERSLSRMFSRRQKSQAVLPGVNYTC